MSEIETLEREREALALDLAATAKDDLETKQQIKAKRWRLWCTIEQLKLEAAGR